MKTEEETTGRRQVYKRRHLYKKGSPGWTRTGYISLTKIKKSIKAKLSTRKEWRVQDLLA